MCSQAAELELGATRLAEVEKADAEKAAEIARLGKALEEAERREVTLEGETASQHQGKEAAKAGPNYSEL